ncbi:MAG TPA: HemK2/MTQ2 family protein methyltransferase [Nitrososphaeraceae archaeon]|nr:HemK2/MTQ2 family protein methyltransferase [Nitrososphaeraceae archaeon]
MYVPSEDSLLLAESVKQYKGKSALEIGIGSGIILKILHDNFKIVAGTDIDIMSVKYCKDNLPNDIMLACCDAASVFHYRFDLIVSNPPYLPIENHEAKDYAINGGSSGIEMTLHFIRSGISILDMNGKMLIISSSLSDTTRLEDSISEMNLKKTIIKERKLFFETLQSIEISFK